MIQSLWSLYSLAGVCMVLGVAYYVYERRGIPTREAALIATLAALAGLSRVPLAGFPGIQPTTFMVIICGAVFGPGAGFMVGSLAAIVSNMLLGQGPWTPWQMLAWGLAGLIGGLLARLDPESIRGKTVMVATAFIWGFIFGWTMNTWHWLTFVYPHTVQSFIITQATSAWFDLMHSISNAVFMLVAGPELIKILRRFQRRLTYKRIKIQE